MNYMTQNAGKMDPEIEYDDCDDLWIGWLVPVGDDPVNWNFAINIGYALRNFNGYSSVICAGNIFGQDDYYRNPEQGNAGEINCRCYRGD
ncbi:hypothetical protein GCG54_00011647 [Colletotrichum gloeosporioides]|uniref:Uncharacterized protein n=1 Tax=Colletotrichum gloeosporioides TaxID=474922 RepID=A0A8H4FK24_COLGL|nr:uncharacterized protein GCG54_00011647 [Colletotrichum gloeosporioides]KAF3803809.1 hypothetical protein GCG54_00011647 [Colletotrichum gloeosporioides]